LAQVMTIRLLGEDERVISLPDLPAKYREKNSPGQCKRASCPPSLLQFSFLWKSKLVARK
jgi:hypothetical protein